ncbi:MAG: hypothetical protein WCP18_03535 [bacterium]
MRMTLGNYHVHNQEQLLTQKQKQQQRQKQKLAQRISLRLDIIQEFRGEQFRVEAICPKCHCNLTIVQVIKGFNRDPHDTTTGCPKCEERFQSHLYQSNSYSRTTIEFLCPAQTLDQLRRLPIFFPDEIKVKNFTAYSSAIFHFGNLTVAFKELGINYKKKEKIDWKQKIHRFLGQAPDSEIARCAGISFSTISRMRKKLKIGRYHFE